jgi:hypothetical protein
VKMVTAPLSRLGISVRSRGRKDPLPSPLTTGIRVLPRESGRKLDPSCTPCDILLVTPLHDREMAAQRLPDDAGQNRQPVAIALPATNDDVVRRKVHVLHAKPRAFEKAEAAPVEQERHELRRSAQVRDDHGDLLAGKNHRKPAGATGADELVEPRELQEDVTIEEEERAQGLILRRGRDPSLDGQSR